MLNKIVIICLSTLASLCLSISLSHAQPDNELGQSIQIYTRFHSYVGRPSWLLVIRDLDHDQNIPYIYDVSRGDNFWLAFTYGRNYLITTSRMYFSPYRTNPYNSKRINNFCNLESNGRIIRGESLYITINGDLSPNANTFTCHISSYPNSNFTVVKPDSTD